MKTNIYKNYGILRAEKRALYSTAAADISDELIVEIPEELHPYETEMGEIAIKPENSYPYLLRETLIGNEKPFISYYDKDSNLKHVELTVMV